MPSATLGVGTSMGTGGGCCAGVPGASSGPLLEAVLLGTETSGSCSCGQAFAQHGLNVRQPEPSEGTSRQCESGDSETSFESTSRSKLCRLPSGRQNVQLLDPIEEHRPTTVLSCGLPIFLTCGASWVSGSVGGAAEIGTGGSSIWCSSAWTAAGIWLGSDAAGAGAETPGTAAVTGSNAAVDPGLVSSPTTSLNVPAIC